jgi:calcineurin-like phosphoesterase family protein
MNYWFTADAHFGHSNIIDYCNRPFADVHEMNKAMTERWNACVQPDDTIYHVGDFCFGDPVRFLEKLNGNIHLIDGSHDKQLRKLFSKTDSIQSNRARIRGGQLGEWRWLGPLHSMVIDKQAITLCHYAMRRWPKSHYGSWLLYGHSHGSLPPMGKSFDVGVDTHNFQPYSLAEVAKKMEELVPHQTIYK